MTKMVCTIGPATESMEALAQLAENGMNVARLNMTHGARPAPCGAAVQFCAEAPAPRAGRPAAPPRPRTPRQLRGALGSCPRGSSSPALVRLQDFPRQGAGVAPPRIRA